MSFLDFLWIFLIITSLQPIVRRRWLEMQRVRAFRRLEAQRGSRLIGLIHRQETMSFLGFPIARFIDIQDSEDVLRAIQLTDPTLPIDLILHTPGSLDPPGGRAKARGRGGGRDADPSRHGGEGAETGRGFGPRPSR